MSAFTLHKIFFAFSLLLMFSSCNQQVEYEKNIDLKDAQWQIEDTLVFKTKIMDAKAKNIFINFRHGFDFNWRNVWLDLSIKYPNDSIYTYPINMPLSQPNGEWYGDHSGNIYLVQFPIEKLSNYTFKDTGVYTFSLTHQMREIPLQHSLSAGIKIENVKEN